MGDSKKFGGDAILPAPRSSESLEANVEEVDIEVFKKREGAVDFRTVGWIAAAVIFLKIIFATGVLSIPTAMYSLGAAPGAVMILAASAANTYMAVVMGNFRRRHPGCHSIADMAAVVGGVALREVVGALFMVAYTICVSSGLVGAATALNALSDHAMCTNYFMVIVTVVCFLLASVRKFEKMAWLTWAGFASVYVAVFIVVVGVTTRDRPATAPQTGPYELGYHAVGSPTFVTGMTAISTIFVSTAGTSAFLPVISEMRKPQDYKKAVYLCMGIVTASYLTFSLVVYRWCGQWVASPSLGSAGPRLKKAAYGLALLGLLVSASLYLHVSAKYLFVRLLRRSPHLQRNTATHWAVWLGSTAGAAAAGLVVASGVPRFALLVALAGCVCFAPLALMLPAYLWVADHTRFRRAERVSRRAAYWAHWALLLVGLFLMVGGTYAVAQEIRAAYASGAIDEAFSCADNSGSS